MPLRLRTAIACGALGIAAGGLMLLSRTTVVSAQVEAAPETVAWEYTTTNIDTGTLQTKLTELGNAGWDVFSITISDSKVETGADGQPHVTAQRNEVTAKRLRKK